MLAWRWLLQLVGSCLMAEEVFPFQSFWVIEDRGSRELFVDGVKTGELSQQRKNGGFQERMNERMRVPVLVTRCKISSSFFLFSLFSSFWWWI